MHEIRMWSNPWEQITCMIGSEMQKTNKTSPSCHTPFNLDDIACPALLLLFAKSALATQAYIQIAVAARASADPLRRIDAQFFFPPLPIFLCYPCFLSVCVHACDLYCSPFASRLEWMCSVAIPQTKATKAEGICSIQLCMKLVSYVLLCRPILAKIPLEL